MNTTTRIRLRLEYFDQNEAFAANLPAEGITVAVDDASRVTRCVLALDVPFTWQLVTDAPISYRLLKVRFVVLQNRWAGASINGSEATSVHILLPLDDADPPDHLLTSSLLLHVAWGMVSRAVEVVS
jgi:hypothetical protein